LEEIKFQKKTIHNFYRKSNTKNIFNPINYC